MKYTFYLMVLTLLIACKNEKSTETDNTTPQAIPSSPEMEILSVASLEEARNTLRNALRMELPNTLPMDKNGQQATRSFSFKIVENDGRPVWSFKEKLYDPATNKLYAGADYLLLWATIDVNSIRLVKAENGEKIGISIKPLKGSSFVYHPYSNVPDSAVEELLIGWYKPVQERTLGRVAAYLKQVAEKMGEWEAKNRK